MERIKSKIKEERGITLIALVVTIIILLILAGVAINMALGDNGLFKRSKEAVNTWKKAEEDEQSVLGEIDSFLGDNIDNSKVKVEYKKTPIKIEENIIYAMQIDFTVSPKMDIEIKSEEYKASVRELVLGKGDKELESILDTLIKSHQELFGITTLESYYRRFRVTDLIGLANVMKIDEHTIEDYGVNTIQEAAIADVINALINENNEAIPFYQEKEGVLYKPGYKITPLNENVEGSGDIFTVLENGTYKFNVKILETGEEIEVEMPVTGISEQGTEYEAITNSMLDIIGLKNKETGKYVTFEEAYAIYKGKIYDVKNSIENVDDEDIFNKEVENYEGEMYSYIYDGKIEGIIGDETGVYPNAFENYTAIIIKDNKTYHIDCMFIPE